jgi:hypothetical protein
MTEFLLFLNFVMLVIIAGSVLFLVFLLKRVAKLVGLVWALLQSWFSLKRSF